MDEGYWDDEPVEAVSSNDLKDMKDRVGEISKATKDTDAKLTILGDDVGDLQFRVKKERDSLREVKRSFAGRSSSQRGPSREEINELTRQIKILENDIKWMD